MKKSVTFILSLFFLLNLIAKDINRSEITVSEDGFVTVSKVKESMIKEQKIPEREIVRGEIIDWNIVPEFLLSNNDDLDTRDPYIAIGPDGTLYTVWQDNLPNHPSGVAQRIVMKKKEVGGDWTEQEVVDIIDLEARNNHRPSIAIADNNDIHIVYQYWAFDGTASNQIAWSFYDASEDIWNQEIVSSDFGTTSNLCRPMLYTTDENLPVVYWGGDERDGNEQSYMSWYNGTNWTELPVSIDSSDPIGYGTKISKLSDNKAMFFYSKNGHLYYKIWNELTHTLSEEFDITVSGSTTGNYDCTKEFEDKVYLTSFELGVLKTFCFDIESGEWTDLEVDVSLYFSDERIDMSIDSNGLVNVFFSITIVNTYNHFTYHPVGGFSEVENLITGDGIAENIGFSAVDENNDIHFVYEDRRFDPDPIGGYVIDEIFYRKGIYNDTDIEDNYELQITNYELKQNYPNPFNPVTKISYELAITNYESAEIVVYNTRGQEVWVSNPLTLNSNHCIFDGSKFNSGIYYYSLIIDGKKMDTKSMVLIK